MKNVSPKLMLAVMLIAMMGTADDRIDAFLKETPPKYTIDASGLQLNNYIARAIEVRSDAFAETNDRRALDDAVRFFRAVNAYPDWRQAHYFQSTAHIMNGISRLLEVGKTALTSEVKAEIELALYEKGVVPSRTAPFWNRNDDVVQICAPAVAYAVFVLKERYPEAYDELFEKAVAAFLKTYENYTDEGNWSAGPSFGMYANEQLQDFSKLMIRLTGDDRGITKNRGYLASKGFIRSLIGLTGEFYNYADGICKGAKELCKEPVSEGAKLFDGPEPVAIVRSATAYLAVKGGKANFMQQHMDAGSFIFETTKEGGAVRWIEDPLPERYRHLQRMKLSLEDYSDASSRWSIDNMSVFHHSVCYLDSKPFSTDAFVPLSLKDGAVVADITAICGGACARASRHLALVDNGLELIDAFEGIKGEHQYCFNFTTFRKVEIVDDKIVFDDGAMTLTASVAGEWKIEEKLERKSSFLKDRSGLHRVSFTAPLQREIIFRFRPAMPSNHHQVGMDQVTAGRVRAY